MSDLSTRARIAQLSDRAEGFGRREIIPRVYANVVAGDPFTVQHTLGAKPAMVSWLPYTDCRVWAEEADERSWDATKVILRCNVSAAPMRLAILE